MNLQRRLKAPETKGRAVRQGFSLLRRSYDEALIGKAAALQERHRNISVFTDVKGHNRLAIHTMHGSELQRDRQRQVLGELSMRQVLRRVIAESPRLVDPKTLTVTGLQVLQDARNSRGGHYLEMMFDEEGTASLKEEIDAIRTSLKGWDEDQASPWTWSEMPLYLGLAATGPLASPGLVANMEQSANEILQPPFTIELTPTELTMPRMQSHR